MKNILINKRFGRWLVISEAGRDKLGKVLLNVQCDCGTRKITHSGYLTRKLKPSRSCGCLAKELSSIRLKNNTYTRKEKGVSGLNTVFQKYRYTAKTHNRQFELTKKEFKKLTSSNCFYCGTPPLKIQYSYFTSDKWKPTQDAIENSGYPYNGIDRVDSSKGYKRENCVSCCYLCNRAKNDMTLEEFKNWIIRIYNKTICQK